MDKGYELILVDGSLQTSWFKSAPADSAMHKLYQRMLRDPSLTVDSFDEARERLRVSKEFL